MHDDGFQSVVQTSDGGFAMVGYTKSYGSHSDKDLWIMKTDASGNEEWSRVIGSNDTYDQHAYSIKQTSDGGYIISGTTAEPESNNPGLNLLLIKTDPNGRIE